MGPSRTPKHQQAESSSAGRASAGSNHKQKHRRLEQDPTALPGVQKLKSSLRQTRRLLAKDKLPADVRVETERRLKALEADLAKAETAKKERAFAVRYHKIKFFERQKVVRKLNQTKKQIAAETTKGSAKRKLEKVLLELRVDLNYILHYPKLKKYVSLFPPEVRHGEQAVDVVDDVAKAKTDAERIEVRTWIRERMENEELSNEPELHLDARDTRTKGKEWSSGAARKLNSKSTKLSKDSDVEEADDFFGDDAEDSDGDEEDRDSS